MTTKKVDPEAGRKAGRAARWNDLVKLEPRLLFLAEEALAYKEMSRGQEYVCANDRWYGYGKWRDRGLRASIIGLVGWFSAGPTELRTMDAYDVAYQHVYHLLPDCRNCACIGY